MIFQKYLEIVINKMKMMEEINLLWKLLEIKINLEIQDIKIMKIINYKKFK